MTPFVSNAKSILNYVNLDPVTPLQLGVAVMAAVLVAALTLHWVARIFHATPGSFGASLLIVVFGGAVTLAAGAAAITFLPDLAGRQPTTELVVIVFGAVSLLLTLPLIRLMWRTSFFSAVAAFVFAALAGAAAVVAVDGVREAFSSGKKELNKGVRHNQEVESLLNGK
ncbi:MAG: hypothetical protein U1F87_09205 [Kiritimatiellia bacterium]